MAVIQIIASYEDLRANPKRCCLGGQGTPARLQTRPLTAPAAWLAGCSPETECENKPWSVRTSVIDERADPAVSYLSPDSSLPSLKVRGDFD